MADRLFKHSTGKVTTDMDFADAMLRDLDASYVGWVCELDNFMNEAADELIAELKATSPVKTGRYRDAWKDVRKKIIPWKGADVKLTVHTITNDETLNSVKYRTVPLAVVLEYGRHSKNGKIVGKKPHINTALAATEKKLTNKIGG